MSSLNDQLNSFKTKIRNAPTIQKRVISDTNDNITTKKRNIDNNYNNYHNGKKTVYSQPRSTGTGNHNSTKLVHTVDYLKQNDGPLKYSDIEQHLMFTIKPLIYLLKNIDRIRVNEKNETIEYVDI